MSPSRKGRPPARGPDGAAIPRRRYRRRKHKEDEQSPQLQHRPPPTMASAESQSPPPPGSSVQVPSSLEDFSSLGGAPFDEDEEESDLKIDVEDVL